MYLSYKLHTSYTFSVDQPSVLTILEGGSFSYKGKSMGHFSSKLTKVTGRDNHMGRIFCIINLNFNRKQKECEPHYRHFL